MRTNPKKRKTKPFGITIDEEVNLETRRIAKVLDVSYSHLVEKCLRYFLYHRKEVWEFTTNADAKKQILESPVLPGT